jgi:hypothetical protein
MIAIAWLEFDRSVRISDGSYRVILDILGEEGKFIYIRKRHVIDHNQTS